MTPTSKGLAARARELSLTLTAWPSVTGTADEAGFAHKLAELLAALPYFRDNPDDLAVLPVPGGSHARASVLALARGTGSRTVVLAGHFDVVPVDDYGDLAPLAFSPEALKAGLIQRLRTTGTFAQALDDLESGRFLPGRGLLDMKSGLAAGMAVLEQFAADPDRVGNLLLIATPDEEDRSDGMRAAVAGLPGFLHQRGLEVALGINLDALCDNGDGADGRVVALGCIGKLLLSALVVGKESHACYPLDGVNAAYLAAELVAEMEYAPELGELAGREIAAAPTALGMKDLKNLYNVTTPGRVWAFWNVLTQRRTAGSVLAIARQVAERAMARARARVAERARQLSPDGVPSEAWSRLEVTTFDAILARALARDPGFRRRFDARAAELATRDDLDLPTRSQLLTELAWDAAGAEGPAVVLGFAAMPYPAVNWDEGAAEDALKQTVLAAMRRTAAATGVAINARNYLPVIVDMSFLGRTDQADLAAIARVTPIWGSSIVWNPAMAGFPMVNIGPWGRDYHHWLERVDQDYAFRVLPLLVWNVASDVLRQPPPS
ncbi:M20/M25/M40 family metallo-hydrolase [Geminicoccus harenae]|uniref:M20/M25/M40 family metallo-hydrolase n=1 Tax=Geminicoccus harenae TaxID=2498453 RepID=UPI001C94A778|nr:M20/M25/M40 family metallo-hydrolase [Geminicoccus harenae]